MYEPRIDLRPRGDLVAGKQRSEACLPIQLPVMGILSCLERGLCFGVKRFASGPGVWGFSESKEHKSRECSAGDPAQREGNKVGHR